MPIPEDAPPRISLTCGGSAFCPCQEPSTTLGRQYVWDGRARGPTSRQPGRAHLAGHKGWKRLPEALPSGCLLSPAEWDQHLPPPALHSEPLARGSHGRPGPPAGTAGPGAAHWPAFTGPEPGHCQEQAGHSPSGPAATPAPPPLGPQLAGPRGQGEGRPRPSPVSPVVSCCQNTPTGSAELPEGRGGPRRPSPTRAILLLADPGPSVPATLDARPLGSSLPQVCPRTPPPPQSGLADAPPRVPNTDTSRAQPHPPVTVPVPPTRDWPWLGPRSGAQLSDHGPPCGFAALNMHTQDHPERRPRVSRSFQWLPPAPTMRRPLPGASESGPEEGDLAGASEEERDAHHRQPRDSPSPDDLDKTRLPQKQSPHGRNTGSERAATSTSYLIKLPKPVLLQGFRL